jgi:hypothetical protein
LQLQRCSLQRHMLLMFLVYQLDQLDSGFLFIGDFSIAAAKSVQLSCMSPC